MTFPHIRTECSFVNCYNIILCSSLKIIRVQDEEQEQVNEEKQSIKKELEVNSKEFQKKLSEQQQVSRFIF